MQILKSWWVFLLCFAISGCHFHPKHRYQGYVEGQNIYLASPFAGVVDKMYVDRGTMVKKGDLLFQLDENPQRLELQETEALLARTTFLLTDIKKPKRKAEQDIILSEIRQVEAKIHLTQLRLDRSMTLLQKKVLDRDTVDTAKDNYVQAKEALEQALSKLELARKGGRSDQVKAQKAYVDAYSAKVALAKWKIAQKKIYAPANGIIYDTYYSEGEYVAAQKPIGSLLPLNDISIAFYVPAEALARIQLQQEITFECEGCKALGEAKISYISQEVEYAPPVVYSRDNADKLVFYVRAKVKNPTQYKPGQPIIAIETEL